MLVLCHNKDSSPNFKISGNFLHSTYNPKKEALSQAQGILESLKGLESKNLESIKFRNSNLQEITEKKNLSSTSTPETITNILIIGFGWGYIIDAFLEIETQNINFYFFEPNLEIKLVWEKENRLNYFNEKFEKQLVIQTVNQIENRTKKLSENQIEKQSVNKIENQTVNRTIKLSENQTVNQIVELQKKTNQNIKTYQNNYSIYFEYELLIKDISTKKSFSYFIIPQYEKLFKAELSKILIKLNDLQKIDSEKNINLTTKKHFLGQWLRNYLINLKNNTNLAYLNYIKKPTPTPTPTSTQTQTQPPIPTPTPTSTQAPTPTPTSTQAPTPIPIPTPTPTSTQAPTPIPIPTPTLTSIQAPTLPLISTQASTPIPIPTPTPTSTQTQTQTQALPLVYVGAGPNLEKEINNLKNINAYIISSDTALAVLLYHKIKVDIVISIDSSFASFYHLIAASLHQNNKQIKFNIPILTLNVTSNYLYKIFNNIILYKSSFPLDQILSKTNLNHLEEWNNPSLNTLGIAVLFAKTIGAKKLFCIGTSFKTEKSKSHANGTGYQIYNLEKIKRTYGYFNYQTKAYSKTLNPKNKLALRQVLKMCKKYNIKLIFGLNNKKDFLEKNKLLQNNVNLYKNEVSKNKVNIDKNETLQNNINIEKNEVSKNNIHNIILENLEIIPTLKLTKNLINFKKENQEIFYNIWEENGLNKIRINRIFKIIE